MPPSWTSNHEHCGKGITLTEDEEDTRPSPLDELFAELEMKNPDHIALKYYRSYHSGSAKTLKSIQITLAARLEKFNLESLAALTCTDELDLPSMGEKKVALFALIPDNDSSFNFLVSILYTQLFQQLFYSADHIHGGALPVSVHFLMDEFANVSLPDDFDKILSVMRSRGVSVSIILQNLAQLKALFEKQWESIVGNCDEFLYLGGNEQSTHKYVSELLGKETIDTNTYGKSSGRSGNYSTNYQISGRELLTPDEVRMLDNQYAILFIRGERPVMDFKYDILKHPNVALTTDGKAAAYKYGEVTVKHSALSVLDIDPNKIPEVNYGETTYELLSDEDFEVNKKLILTEEITMTNFNKNNEKKTTQKLPMTGKVKRGFHTYCAAVVAVTALCSMGITAFAANDPIAVVNNLSNFIFGLIRAIGMILLGFGIVQAGLSLKSHDPSQRANGFLTLAGGIIITFAKEILNLIAG